MTKAIIAERMKKVFLECYTIDSFGHKHEAIVNSEEICYILDLPENEMSFHFKNHVNIALVGQIESLTKFFAENGKFFIGTASSADGNRTIAINKEEILYCKLKASDASVICFKNGDLKGINNLPCEIIH